MASPLVNMDQVKASVRVARFLKPDLREWLYDYEPVLSSSLGKELREVVQLDNLKPGEVLILNMGLIDWFPTQFYRLLLELRNELKARDVKLILCCIPTRWREGFDLMGGSKIFDIRATESRAISDGEKMLIPLDS